MYSQTRSEVSARDAASFGFPATDSVSTQEPNSQTDVDLLDSSEDSVRNSRSATSERQSLADRSAIADFGDEQASVGSASDSPAGDSRGQLFSPEESDDFHVRWNAVQVNFVDEPRKAVQEADGLVADAVKRLSEVFAEERVRLESQWDKGGNVSTEQLRLALRRYRAFFGRLLAV